MDKARLGAIALAPTLLALLCAYLLEQQVLSNPVLVGQYQVDAAGLVSRGGLLAGGITIFVLLVFWRAEWRAEKVLLAEQRMQLETRRSFFRRLDHELKNPLAVIKLALANLQLGPELSPVQAASLGRVGQQAERLQSLVENLRWLTELEDQPLEHRPVDLVALLQEAVDLARAAHPQRAITLHAQQVPWPLSAVTGDRDLLLVVFRNLLDNALKYSATDDAVELRAGDDGAWVTVEVADSGRGIPDAARARIFEELYRAANVGDVPGSGLGLALAWRIIRLHAGEIGVVSRVGQGTVVTVRLAPAA